MRCHYRHRAHQDRLLLPGTAGHQRLGGLYARGRSGERCAARRLRLLHAGRRFCWRPESSATFIRVRDSGVACARLAAQARLLLLPGEMGENFKVLGATRRLEGPLLGFAFQDLRRTL